MAGCPVTFEVKLTNEAGSNIYIVYAPGYEVEIKPGETKKEVYQPGCIRIRIDGEVYEYQGLVPSDEYFDVGIFASSIRAVFTNDRKFKISAPNGRFGQDFYLRSGCI